MKTFCHQFGIDENQNQNKVWHGWRFDPGFTAKSVKKILRGENEHWEFLDILFLG